MCVLYDTVLCGTGWVHYAVHYVCTMLCYACDMSARVQWEIHKYWALKTVCNIYKNLKVPNWPIKFKPLFKKGWTRTMVCLSGKANGKRLPLKTLKTKIHQIRELNWLEQNETLDKLLQRKLNYEDAWHKRQLGPPAGDLGSKNLVPLVPLVPLVHLVPLVALTGT